MSPYQGPELLTADHVTEGFDCGDEVLNEWLRRRAPRNQKEGSSRTAGFYHHFGFESSPMDDLTLMLLIKDINP